MKFALLDDDDGRDAQPWAARALQKANGSGRADALSMPLSARLRAPSDDEEDESTASSDQSEGDSSEDEDVDSGVAARLAELRMVGRTRQGEFGLIGSAYALGGLTCGAGQSCSGTWSCRASARRRRLWRPAPRISRCAQRWSARGSMRTPRCAADAE